MLTYKHSGYQPSSVLKPRSSAAMQPGAFALRLLMILLLAALIAFLAYQIPVSDHIPIGWLGDRLFLDASEGWSSSDSMRFYGDELTPDARSGRSRWTHQGAEIRLPGPGHGDLSITAELQGWPANALNTVGQPQVKIFVDGQFLTEFTPNEHWTIQRFSIPSNMWASDDLVLTLQSSAIFTGTQSYTDPRPKGLRVAELLIEGAQSTAIRAPAAMPMLLFMLSGAVCFLAFALGTRRYNLSFIVSTVLLLVLGLGLVLARIWLVALLPWLLIGLLLLLLWMLRHVLLAFVHRLYARLERSTSPGYALLALTLVGVLGACMQMIWKGAGSQLRFLPDTFPDVLLFGLLGLCLLGLMFVRGQYGLPHLAQRLTATLNGKPGLYLCLLFLAIWLISLASINATLAYVGHADYADNAVVARNLAQGRGWVVDYVTQFYRLYDGVTRPQETWPLLQPVWIAPFFILFGVSSWVAKIPNLVFTALLGWLVYRFGAQQWSRPVGLLAMILLLTSHLFFKLAIYVTSDLAFVVFAFGAMTALYRWATRDRSDEAGDERRETRDERQETGDRRQEAQDTRQETGDRRQETGDRRQEAPDRRHETGDRRQEAPDTRHETGDRRQEAPDRRPPKGAVWQLVLSGLLTGLMVVQKPGSGGLIAVGMGLWLISQVLRGSTLLRYRLRAILLWACVAGVIIMPLIGRNMSLFGKPYFSTESYDAWILEYSDWDRIYGVYAPELSDSGVPDRSWVLRWGFDRTLQKMSNQLKATRDYLVPAWPGLPSALSELMGRSDKDIRLLFDIGAWLGVLGLAGLVLRRSRLPGLLVFAFVPYILFLILYWHANEERYFVVLMPWLALLAAMALWQLSMRIAGLAHGRWAPVGLLLVVLGMFWIMSPSWDKIEEKVRYEPQLYAADLDAYSWLKAHTPAQAVMMTRNPWQLNWSAERPALMIPYTTDRDTFLWLAKHYNAQYLVLDSLQRPDPELRKLIAELLADPSLGFEEVYRTPVYTAEYGIRRGEVFAEIYKFPANMNVQEP